MIDGLAGELERQAAGGEDGYACTATEQELGDPRHDAYVLTVIEYEQRVPRGEVIAECLQRRPWQRCAVRGERSPDCAHDRLNLSVLAIGRVQRGELHEQALGRVRELRAGDQLERQAGLADPSGAGQRHQAAAFEQADDIGQFGLATDQWRQPPDG